MLATKVLQERDTYRDPVAVSQSRAVTVIRPYQSWDLLDLLELWNAKGLVTLFVWRTIRLRYKQTALGVSWVVIQPLAMTLVFTIVFKRIANVPSGDIPYPLFVLPGIILWSFLATSVTSASNSIITTERLITRVYFPRFVLPMAQVGASLIDFSISFCVLVCVMVIYGIGISVKLLIVPFVVLAAVFLALGVGGLLAAINVTYRDIRYIVPFAVQLWMFATPTIYLQVPAASLAHHAATSGAISPSGPSGLTKETSTGMLAELHDIVLRANPMCALTSSFRAALVDDEIPWDSLAVSMVIVLVVFAFGFLYFRRVEVRFADVL
jgi:lipopolysaccharide transport system permease protein